MHRENHRAQGKRTRKLEIAERHTPQASDDVERGRADEKAARNELERAHGLEADLRRNERPPPNHNRSDQQSVCHRISSCLPVKKKNSTPSGVQARVTVGRE